MTIKDGIDLIIKRIWLITGITLVSLLCFFIYNYFVRSPVYTASVQLYVDNGMTASNENLSQLNYAQKVVNTYISFLQTEEFYRRIEKEIRNAYTSDEIREMTKIEIVNQTEIFQISVTSYSAQDSYNITKAMEKHAPVMIGNITNNTRINVVDPARKPSEPSGPNILVNIALGGCIGLLLGVGLALFMEMLDIKVKTKEELEKKYSLPVLGSIPGFGKRKTKEINFVTAESYKSLRENLRYILQNEGCKRIVVNSAVPEEGKSTTCASLAIAVAQTGASVLVIDCDLRKGRMHRIFSRKSSPGLSDYLSGIHVISEIIQSTRYKNLQLITMGSYPPNPAELLSRTKMVELLKDLEKRYDYILIDTPPITIVSDALSLAKISDGVLLVVRENSSIYPNIESAINQYNLLNVKILGFVLNYVTVKKSKYSKSGYYYYGKEDNDGGYTT